MSTHYMQLHTATL